MALQLSRFCLNSSLSHILSWVIFGLRLLFPSLPGGSHAKRTPAGWRSPWRRNEAAQRHSEWHKVRWQSASAPRSSPLRPLCCRLWKEPSWGCARLRTTWPPSRSPVRRVARWRTASPSRVGGTRADQSWQSELALRRMCLNIRVLF